MRAISLQELQAESRALFANRAAFAPALDWVEQILPRLPAACRHALQHEDFTALEAWLEWVGGAGFTAVEVAGNGAVFAWRRAWTLRLLEVTQQLQRVRGKPDAPERAQIAVGLAQCEIAAIHLPSAFWRCLLDTLLDTSPSDIPHSPSDPATAKLTESHFTVPFPCLLSERVVMDGAETNVLLALFTARMLPRGSGQAFLHPEQIALRCMDATFAETFAQASSVVRRHLAAHAGQLPDFCLRLQALRPDQESFLQGLTLRGGSGSGALALTLYGQHAGLSLEGGGLAASFAFDRGSQADSSPRCVPVQGTAEKVRGCAGQKIGRLLVAASQSAELALYGRRNGVEIVGVRTFDEAVACVEAGRSSTQRWPLPEMFPLRPADKDKAEDEEEGGIVPTGSRYYVARPQDALCYEAIHKGPMILLVKGARQMGKSSLLVRGVERAREAGYRVVWTDMQKLNAADLKTLPNLYLALANMLTRQLKLPTSPQASWNADDSPNMNFEYFLLDQVLERTEAPILWFCDEVDRLFAHDFYSEVFSLMRSWHNDRGVQPLWQRLTLALSYATETHLFIHNRVLA